MNSQIIESTDPKKFDEMLNKFLEKCEKKFFVPTSYNYSTVLISKHQIVEPLIHYSCLVFFAKLDPSKYMQLKNAQGSSNILTAVE